MMICKDCGYQTENKKSFSNHIRNGCPKIRRSDKKCKYCECNMPKRKPSEEGLFCNRNCYYKWVRRENPYQGEKAHRYKTGESKTRLYAIWLGVKRRCFKQNCKDYCNYGGRGITICDDWNTDFFKFKHWAETNGYKNKLTIERINVNGNYDPENCTWIPHNEQSKNRRNVKK
jgi:hypothetical protein